LVTGKTVGGASMYPAKNCLSREEALRLYTQGSSWFSSESGKKGAIAPGQLAGVVALTEDYFSVPEKNIKDIESVLTVMGGDNRSCDRRIHFTHAATASRAAGCPKSA